MNGNTGSGSGGANGGGGGGPRSRGVARTFSTDSRDSGDDGLRSRRGVSRTYSGYDSADSAYESAEDLNNSNSVLVRIGGAMPPRRSAKRKKKKDLHSSRSALPIVPILLAVGLFFCALDAGYVVIVLKKDDARQSDVKAAVSKSNGNSNSSRTAANVDAILNDPERAHIVQLLKDAKIDFAALDPETVQQIPKWREVTDLYGSEPAIAGLETCDDFMRSPNPAAHFVSTAGTFNTGTNLMAELLIANCHMPARMKEFGASQRGVRWQVLWGKHTPVFNETFRQTHRTYNDSTLEADHIFPAVMVRDPLKWMQSMCRHEYAANWKHNKEHCPNLVFTNEDKKSNDDDDEAGDDANKKRNGIRPTLTGGVPLSVQYSEFRTRHDTLVGFWNDWYRQYADVKWPRLLVRFEDLIFFPKQVTKTVCECAGGELNHRPFKYITESAKKGTSAHGKKSERTTYLDALIKYGTEAGRYNGYRPEDLKYAQKYLDPRLMDLFKYKLPPSTAIQR